MAKPPSNLSRLSTFFFGYPPERRLPRGVVPEDIATQLSLYLPRQVAKNVELDIAKMLAIEYNVEEELAPEEEIRQAEGLQLFFPLRGWFSAPGKAARRVVGFWTKSVFWDDVPALLEKEFIWKPLLAEKWGFARWKADPSTGARIIDPQTKAGVIEKLPDTSGLSFKKLDGTPFKPEELGDLSESLLDWVGSSRSLPKRRLLWRGAFDVKKKGVWKPGVREKFLKLIDNKHWLQINAAPADKRAELVEKLWKEFGEKVAAGKLDPNHPLVQLYKTLEGRYRELEIGDVAHALAKGQLLRTFVWLNPRFKKFGRIVPYFFPTQWPYLLASKILKKYGYFGGQRILNAIGKKLSAWRKNYFTPLVIKVSSRAKIWLKKRGLDLLAKRLLGGAAATLGSTAGPLGSAIGAVVGAFASEILLKLVRPLLTGLVLFVLGFIGAMTFLMIFILFVIGSIFGVGGTGGLPGEAGQIQVQVLKTACSPDGNPAGFCNDPNNFQNPLRVSNGSRTIFWRVHVKNLSASAIEGARVRDDRCETAGKDLETLDSGEEAVLTCTKAETATDKVVNNVVRFTSTSPSISTEAVGSLIFGNPPADYPIGWPTERGCITQGPNQGPSHWGDEAIDIGSNWGVGYVIAFKPALATHTGTVTGVCGDAGGCGYWARGKWVAVTSPLGFRTHYYHLNSASVSVGDLVSVGVEVGRIDDTGRSTGHHLHYQFFGLTMAPPNIPADPEKGLCW